MRKACPMGTKALPESAVTQASRASVHREGAQEVLKEHKDKAALCVNPALLAAQEAAPGSPRFTRAVCVSIAVCVLAVVAAAAMQPGGKTNTYTPAPPRQGATSGFWGMGRKAKAAAPATVCRAEGPWFVGAGRRLRVSKKHEGRNLTFVPRKVGEALPTTISTV